MSSVAYENINNEVTDNELIIELCNVINEFNSECENAEINYHINTDILTLEKEVFESVDESDEAYLINESENLIKTLGDAIIRLCERVINAINGYIERIKNYNFKHKNLKRRIELIKNKSNFTDEEIKVVCKDGNLDLTSYDTFDKMMDAFNNACEMAANGSTSTEIEKKYAAVFGNGAKKEDVDKLIQINQYNKSLADQQAANIRVLSALNKLEKELATENTNSKRARGKLSKAKDAIKNVKTDDTEVQNTLKTFIAQATSVYQSIVKDNMQILSSVENSLESFADKAEKENNKENDTENK